MDFLSCSCFNCTWPLHAYNIWFTFSYTQPYRPRWCSCIDKKTGYNLLTPIAITPIPKIVQPKEKQKHVANFKKETIKELTEICKTQCPTIDATLEDVSKLNVLSTIREWIESLALESTLRKEDCKLWEDFKDSFEPIPHITKSADKHFPAWTQTHQHMFDSIKELLVSHECLTTIDFTKMPEHKIYITTNASNTCSGAVLSFGLSWEAAQLVAFDSLTFKDAELHYLIHEKELLAVIQALKKWHSDLIGSPFFVFTDHKTLESFETQKELSCRQARWMELLSQYDAHFIYIKGERNTVANSLSRRPINSTSSKAEKHATQPYPASFGDKEDFLTAVFNPGDTSFLCIVVALTEGERNKPTTPAFPFSMRISAEKTFLTGTTKWLKSDLWTKSPISALPSMEKLWNENGLWFLDDRLIILNSGNLHKTLFRLAHNNLGHFGANKIHEALHTLYYWPYMHKDLESAYVPSCIECQRNKSSTIRSIAPLHLLLIPDEHWDSVTLDFIGHYHPTKALTAY